MNILKDIVLSENGPSVSKIQVNESIQYIGIGLKKEVVLKDHKTPVPAILTVLLGKIRFIMTDTEIELTTGDVFNIPVDVMHRVEALEDTHFTVLKTL